MTGTTAAQRRSALVLHAVAPADRDWILGRLPAHEQTALRALLDELKALGIPADQQLLAEAGVARGRKLTAVPLTVAGPAVLAQADGRRVAELLHGEPLTLITELLLSRNWRWEPAFLEALDPARRVQVEERLRQMRSTVSFGAARRATPGPAALRHVEDQLTRQLRGTGLPARDPASLGRAAVLAASPWARLWRLATARRAA